MNKNTPIESKNQYNFERCAYNGNWVYPNQANRTIELYGVPICTFCEKDPNRVMAVRTKNYRKDYDAFDEHAGDDIAVIGDSAGDTK